MPSINEFVNKMSYGARTNLFKVYITQLEFENAEFFVKAASIPARSMGVTPIHYKNNIINFVGDTTTFPEWSCTVINDENFSVRSALESWMDSLKAADDTMSGMSLLGGSADIEIVSYDPNMNELAHYIISDAFPTEIGAIELGWESESVQEYQVTFAYNYWQRAS